MSDTINIYTKNRTKIFTAIFMFCLSFNVLGQKCTTSIKKGTDRFTNKVSYYFSLCLRFVRV